MLVRPLVEHRWISLGAAALLIGIASLAWGALTLDALGLRMTPSGLDGTTDVALALIALVVGGAVTAVGVVLAGLGLMRLTAPLPAAASPWAHTTSARREKVDSPRQPL